MTDDRAHARTVVISDRNGGGRTATASAVAAFAFCSLVASSASAEKAAEPQDSKLFSEEWVMAKVADAKEYGVDKSKAAGKDFAVAIVTGVLKGGGYEEIATAALSAVMDSYVPGLSSMLGLTGEGDPFAAHAKAIIDRIDAAETRILDEMAAFWNEARENRSIDLQSDFNALVSDLHAWDTEYTSWGQLALPQLYTSSIRDMRHFTEWAALEIPRPANAKSGTAPYPYLHHLETFAQVTQLQLLHAPRHAYIVASQGMGVINEPTYRMASADTIAAIDEMAQPPALNSVDNALTPAFALADKLAAVNPFKARVTWMFKEAARIIDFSKCNPYDKAVVDAVTAHGLRPVGVNLNGLAPLHYNIRREIVANVREVEERSYCIYAGQRPHPFNSFVYLSTYDKMTRVFGSQDEAFTAHREGMYNMMLRVGWGPYRAFLDQWWNTLKKHGLRAGDRPYTTLDRELDNYLVEGSDAPLFTVIDALKRNTRYEGTFNVQRRSKFVDFALRNGPDALYSMLWYAGGYDPLEPVGRYPLAIHEQLIAQGFNRIPLDDFYRGQFAAKATVVLR